MVELRSHELPRLFSLARRTPDALALDDLERSRSWGELLDRSQRIAQFLRHECGLDAGHHVASLVGNRVEAIELVLASLLAGLWITPIQRHLAREEIAYVVRDSGARVLFTDDEHAEAARAAAQHAAEAASGDHSAPRVVRVGPELDAGLAETAACSIDFGGPPGGTLIYTGGTTGRPKGVKRARAATLGDALRAGTAIGAAIGLDGDGPHLVTGPLYHAAPLLHGLYDLLQGAPLVILPRWDEERALELLASRGIRHTHMVPTMFVRLLRLPDEVRRRFDPSELRLVLHGAAPIAPAVKRRMIDWWGEVLVEYWGATESGVCTLIDSRDWLAHPGSVGRALPAFEVFAVDDEGGRLPPGVVGRLACRRHGVEHPFVYHGDEEKTRRAYVGSGAFTFGDVGRVDEDGYVFLTDRESHTIISGGVNIYPAEIEAVLVEHPAVNDVAVFGIPDDEWGESVKAAVELATGFQPSDALAHEILAFARERLASYKVPRSVDFEPRLPRQPTGKLHVRELRDRYWAGRERRI